MTVKFEEQVDYYKEMYRNTMAKVTESGGISTPIRILGLDEEKVKADFAENNEDFKKFVTAVASSLVEKRDPDPMTYSAVILSCVETFGETAKAYLCTSVLEDNEESLEKAKEIKESNSDEEHPFPINSMYVEIGDRVYEYYQHSYEGIVHLDSIEV